MSRWVVARELGYKICNDLNLLSDSAEKVLAWRLEAKLPMASLGITVTAALTVVSVSVRVEGTVSISSERHSSIGRSTLFTLAVSQTTVVVGFKL